MQENAINQICEPYLMHTDSLYFSQVEIELAKLQPCLFLQFYTEKMAKGNAIVPLPHLLIYIYQHTLSNIHNESDTA